MHCNGYCEEYKVSLGPYYERHLNYARGLRYCCVCNIFMKPDGAYSHCPCCKVKLRSNARNSRKRRLEALECKRI